jgi:alpha/beta superfamily hydrolase
VYFKHPDKHGPLLEGVLHLPEAAAPHGGAVVCHPHPEYGGSMDVPLVVAIAKGLARAGWAALRFNFRGVGQSQGTYDEGRGEVEDVEAAAAYIRGHDAALDGPLALVGYSFGAWVALEAARRVGTVAAVAAVALPLWRMPEGWLNDLDIPKLLVAGDRDTVCPVAELKAWAGGLSGPTEIAILTRADHYLAGREGQVADEVARFLNAHAKATRERAK